MAASPPSHAPEVQRVYNKTYREKLRAEILDAYGRCCACENCPEHTNPHVEFLTLDHINGGGLAHRKRIGSAYGLMGELRRLGFPPGYQILCWNCNLAKGIHGVCPHERDEDAEV